MATVGSRLGDQPVVLGASGVRQTWGNPGKRKPQRFGWGSLEWVGLEVGFLLALYVGEGRGEAV